MGKTRSSNKKAEVNSLSLKLIFVALAFVLMIVSSCAYVSNLLHTHLIRDAQDALAYTKAKIETDIVLAEAILVNLADNVDRIITDGGDESDVLEYLHEFMQQTQNDERMDRFSFRNVRGYFDVFGGLYIDGSGWEAPGDYDATTRPWYLAAVEADGYIGIVPVYWTIYSETYDMSYSICVFDDSGQRLFVLALNVPLISISEYVTSMNISENSYGILQSEDMGIIAHPSDDFVGQYMSDLSEEFSASINDAQKDSAITEYEMINYRGEQAVIFTTKLDNGWLLSAVIPQSEYYQELVTMTMIISALGAIMALILIIILVRIEKAKRKSDDKARQQEAMLEAMEKLRELEEQTQIMLDATPICCKLWSRDLQLLACNEECVRVFEVSSKEEFLESFYKLSPEYQPDGTLTKDKAALLVPKAFEEGYAKFEWMHMKKTGVLLPAEVTLVRVNYRDDYAVAGFIRDLTEHYKMLDEINEAAEELRIARDAAESANRAKSSFLANMSHEMRTPLNVVVGLTDLHIEEEDLPEVIHNDLKKINTAGGTILSIVNDVLDISKIEAGRFELTPVIYNSASLLNDIITLNMIRVESKPVFFDIEIDENMPSEIFGDELRIKQIFNNLLSNSFKYTHEGSVTLNVSCERADDDFLWMNISVSDTGTGIKKEDLNKLFTDYSQVDKSANRRIEGTGLGLSITKKMVEMMDGSISVESEYGKGSTFSVRISQKYIESEPLGRDIVENLRSFRYTDTKQHVSQKIVRVDMSYARVLVVDDFQTNLDVAAGLIQKYQIHVDCVNSGQDALDRIERGVPVYDAVFMDHMMPGMDGIEATKRIRALDTEYSRSVPIISLTANAIAGNEQMFLDSGFQAFLSKPIDIMKLDMVLKEWVRDKSKEIHVSEIESPNAKEGEEIVTSVKIFGIDEEKGLGVYGYDMDLYISVLRSFVKNTPELIERLKGVTKETLEEYAVNVHGLKGSVGNIGAEVLRIKASLIEDAANAGELSKVQAENKELLSNAEALVGRISSWLDKHDHDIIKPILPAPDPELLKSLRGYCEKFDMNKVDEVTEQLEGFRYEKDAGFIVWLREKVDTSDFNAIVGRISELGEVLK